MQHLQHSIAESYGAVENRSFEDFIDKLQTSFWPSLAASITDSHALERLSEAVIKELANAADVTDWQACCTLHTLYGKLFKERATTRYV